MTTLARLTFSTLFGHRRGLLMFVLPAVLLALALLLRLTLDNTADFSADLLQQLAVAVIVPLVALVAGTGAIATEIDDGSIVYLLSKPVGRHTIIAVKTAVALGCTTVFGVLPVVATGLLLAPSQPRTALGFGVGALVAGVAYVALFIALSVVSGNPVVVGLLYALLWEGVMGQYVAGARALSVQQWALAVVREIVGTEIESAVTLPAAIGALVVVTVGALVLATVKLRSLVLSND
jgi:ABC-2 type transport system permease protein